MSKALVVIDYINEIVHSDGKLSGKGYADFIVKNNVEEKLANLLTKARAEKWLVCHVKVGFDADYLSHPADSPLFGAAKEYNALNLDEWGCEFVSYAEPAEGESILTKHRVSAFFNTDLDALLKRGEIKDVYFAGCSTDLAVQSAVRDAHDRDYRCFVVADACAAATSEDHTTSLEVLQKIAAVTHVADV